MARDLYNGPQHVRPDDDADRILTVKGKRVLAWSAIVIVGLPVVLILALALAAGLVGLLSLLMPGNP